MRAARPSGVAWWFAGRLVSIAAASAWAALAGCGDDVGGVDDDGEQIPWHAQRAAEVRELDYLDEVEVVRMTRAEFRAQAEANADEIDEAELLELADTYGRLGFFPLDADLRPILAGNSDWVGASYSPLAKRITVVEDAPGDASDSIEVHEYVHALQDQHFDLLAYDGATSDEYLARRAVVEGDATLAELRFVAQDEHNGELDGWDWSQLLDNYRTWGAGLLDEAAFPLFLDYPSFVYPYGLAYTATNLLGANLAAPPPHDWGLEDELFTDRPPATVRQVMLPEVVELETIGLDAVPAALAGRLEALGWDTLGAWYIHLLLYRQLPFGDAYNLATAWQGDRVLFVRVVESGAVATVWASKWIGSEDASRVAAAIDELFQRTKSTGDPRAGTAADGEPLWVEYRSNRMVAIKNVSPGLASEIADEALYPPPAARAPRSRPPLARRLRQLVY